MKILGILNITTDSFSDGGKYLAPEAALAHAQKLTDEGADIIDIGAASSNPDAGAVTPELEIARLASVVPALKAKGLSLSIDSFAPEVQRWALEQPIDYLNDIHGFPDPALYPALAASDAKLIVMHAIQARGIATLHQHLGILQPRTGPLGGGHHFGRANATVVVGVDEVEGAGVELDAPRGTG